MRNYITIIFIVLNISLNAQTKYNQDFISESTDKVVKKIEIINELMGSSVYYSATRPPQYDNFDKLKEIASKEELIELTNHPNGVVRCYAFWALSYDMSVDLFPILINHIHDYELIHTQFGCIGSQDMVGDFFISIVTPRYIDLESEKLDSVHFLKLDSILIYSNSKLYAKSEAILKAVPTDLIYPKIRALVIENNNQSALVTLAKYHKQEDIPLILKNREESESDEDGYFYTYKAIQEFPHPDFIPFLEKNLNKTLDDTGYYNEWKELYKAIATYKSKKSVELLKMPFSQVQYKEIRQYHIDFVYDAIQQNRCKIYDSLLWQMWEKENRITPDIYHYLVDRDSLKAFGLTKKSILQSDKMYEANLNLCNNNLGSIENLTSIMVDDILKKDHQMGIKIICKNIKKTNVQLFAIFADEIIKLNDPVFIEPLFDRLKKEWNAHVILKIAETLIAYKDVNINKRILDTIKINDDLKKNWGGEALSKMLKDNRLIE